MHWNLQAVKYLPKKPLSIPNKKKCNSCGKLHAESTDDQCVCNMDMLYFNCECHSTLVVPCGEYEENFLKAA